MISVFRETVEGLLLSLNALHLCKLDDANAEPESNSPTNICQVDGPLDGVMLGYMEDNILVKGNP